MAVVIQVGGVGAALQLEDVVRVANGEATVALDAPALERIKKESPAPKNFKAEETTAAEMPASTTILTSKQARAGVLFKLLSLVQGHSKVRPVVLVHLAELLNSLQPLRLSCGQTDRESLAELANMLSQADLKPPGISSEERAVLEAGEAITAGASALLVELASTLLAAATAVAAVSFEALQAEVKAFDLEAAEAQPVKSALQVASDLRGLLGGSKQVNGRAGVGAPGSVVKIPLYHGGVEDALSAAAARVKAELATAARPVTKDNRSQLVVSPELTNCLLFLGSAVLRMGSLSLQRTQLLEEQAAKLQPTSAQVAPQLSAASNAIKAAREELRQLAADVFLEEFPEDEVPGVAAARVATRALEAAQLAVAVEAFGAVVLLRQQEGPRPPAGENGSVPAAPGSLPADGPSSKKDKGGKKGKGGGGFGPLGKGTSILRAYVEAAAARRQQGAADGLAAAMETLQLSGEGSSDLSAGFEAVAAALDPASPGLAQQLDALRRVVEANQVSRLPKVAKGTRDYAGAQMVVRELAIGKISAAFKRHGATGLDTPVFELRETLMGKYGEDSKLIYDLADQGGEVLSLRYDLTVPFARYVALNPGPIKRYQIGKVYRRDQPQMNRGRYREFYQCDFDIAGSYPAMVPDAEVLKVLVELLGDLDIGAFQVKLNHRRLLDATLAIAGVPAAKFRPICSAIDKLDKEPWETVRREMVDQKGLAPEVADTIGQFVQLRGAPLELLEQLSQPDHPLQQSEDARAALADLALLFELLGAMGALGALSFDLSLARGLDYYTGVIYEAVLLEGSVPVGSIAAGGRYDKLVGMFSGKDVPAVGVSIGIERVFTVLEKKLTSEEGMYIRCNETEVYVVSIAGKDEGEKMRAERLQLASQLWAAGIKAEFSPKVKTNMKDELDVALKAGIPFMLVFGSQELEAGVVGLKDLDAGSQADVPRSELVPHLAARIAQLPPDRRVRCPMPASASTPAAAAK